MEELFDKDSNKIPTDDYDLYLKLTSIETNKMHKKMAEKNIQQMAFSRKYMYVVSLTVIIQTIIAVTALFRFWDV